MRKGYIYLIVIRDVNYQYVGQTIRSLKNRMDQHKYAKSVVGNYIRKYGFHYYILETCDECDLDNREIYYIDLFKTKKDLGFGGLNLADGGNGTRGLSKESIRKASMKRREYYKTHDGANKGRVFSQEIRDKISRNHADMRGENGPMWGKHHNGETKRKISNAHNDDKKSIGLYSKGGHLLYSYECLHDAEKDGYHRSTIKDVADGKAISHKGYFWRWLPNELTPQEIILSNKKNDKIRAVDMYSLDGILIMSFQSISDACEYLNIDKKSSSKISAVCKNKRKKAYGYIWRYA